MTSFLTISDLINIEIEDEKLDNKREHVKEICL